MATPKPKNKHDIIELMAQIRQQVKTEMEGKVDEKIAFIPSSADWKAGAEKQAGELSHSEELRYLNKNCNKEHAIKIDEIVSHRKGIIGKVIVSFKRKLASIINISLKDFFRSEVEYKQQLVRFLNQIGVYVDIRDGGNFWELSRKIDKDNEMVLERFERLHGEYAGLDHALRKELRIELAHIKTQISTLDGVVKGFESILSRLKPAKTDKEQNEDINPITVDKDYTYVLFENRFRGGEDEIRIRQQMYANLFKTVPGKVVEIAAGRGELQNIFKKSGIDSYGIDIDSGMVDMAKASGADVRLEDGFKHLENLPDASIGGVIALQFVEHLTHDQLQKFIRLCAKKVKKGGKIIYETINPKSLLALSSNYFRDLTHKWPLHPDTLSYVMDMSGIKTVEVKYLARVAENSMLAPLPPLLESSRLSSTVAILNENINQLNELLYGYQDYCVIGEVI